MNPVLCQPVKIFCFCGKGPHGFLPVFRGVVCFDICGKLLVTEGTGAVFCGFFRKSAQNFRIFTLPLRNCFPCLFVEFIAKHPDVFPLQAFPVGHGQEGQQPLN